MLLSLSTESAASGTKETVLELTGAELSKLITDLKKIQQVSTLCRYLILFIFDKISFLYVNDILTTILFRLLKKLPGNKFGISFVVYFAWHEMLLDELSRALNLSCFIYSFIC